MRFKEYRMTAILDGWKVVCDEVKARTDKEAKSKFKRRHPKTKDVIIRYII